MVPRAMPSSCRKDSLSATAPWWRERRRKTQDRRSTGYPPPLNPTLLQIRMPLRGHGAASAWGATNPASALKCPDRRAAKGGRNFFGAKYVDRRSQLLTEEQAVNVAPPRTAEHSRKTRANRAMECYSSPSFEHSPGAGVCVRRWGDCITSAPRSCRDVPRSSSGPGLRLMSSSCIARSFRSRFDANASLSTSRQNASSVIPQNAERTQAVRVPAAPSSCEFRRGAVWGRGERFAGKGAARRRGGSGS